MDTQYRIYLDNLQRLIMGEFVEILPEKQRMIIKNPMILHVQTEGPKINIQFFPMMFKEFLADKDQATLWEVSLNSITPCHDIPLDIRLISQYKQMFSPVKANFGAGQPAMSPMPSENNPAVIKLFDD